MCAENWTFQKKAKKKRNWNLLFQFDLLFNQRGFNNPKASSKEISPNEN